MRKDQELFGSDALDDHVSHMLGFESALGQEIATKDALLGRKHVGLNTLRAQAGDADPIIAMRDRKPLEERERRRFRHSVWSCEDVVEQARRGHRAEEVTLLALEHAGQDVPRREHVRHHIHVPYALPVSGGRFGPATNSDAGVGAEEIDAPVRGLSFIHKVGDLVLTGDVALDRHATDLSRDGPGAVSVDVRNDDRFRTLFGELPRQRAPNASGSASHDDDAISYVHATYPRASLSREASWPVWAWRAGNRHRIFLRNCENGWFPRRAIAHRISPHGRWGSRLQRALSTRYRADREALDRGRRQSLAPRTCAVQPAARGHTRNQ